MRKHLLFFFWYSKYRKNAVKFHTSQRFGLQGIIFLIILGKIQSLCFLWNAFAGIVPKFPALVFQSAHSFFGTEDLSVLQMCAVKTVSATAFYFFSKQNDSILRNLEAPLYTNCLTNATSFLCFPQDNDGTENSGSAERPGAEYDAAAKSKAE